MSTLAVNRAAVPATGVPGLHTARLRLGAFKERHVDRLVAMLADPEVMRFIPGGPVTEPAAAWRSLGALHAHWVVRGVGLWAVENASSGVLLGRAGFFQPSADAPVELSWMLHRDAWGQGVAQEAVGAVLAHGWERGLDGVVAQVHRDNVRSIRLAVRLGGRMDSAVHPGDFLVYRFLP